MISKQNRPALVALLAPFLFLLSPAYGQEELFRTSELPLFQALAGKRQESGVLRVHSVDQNLQGSAVSVGQPFLGGLWFQIDGSANYPPTQWNYRWSFRVLKEGDRLVAVGTYVDSQGNHVRYRGLYDTEEQRIQMVSEGGKGVDRFQMTLLEGGAVRIESLAADSEENPIVTYVAENVAAQ